jgi:hypothetical protein
LFIDEIIIVEGFFALNLRDIIEPTYLPTLVLVGRKPNGQYYYRSRDLWLLLSSILLDTSSYGEINYQLSLVSLSATASLL